MNNYKWLADLVGDSKPSKNYSVNEIIFHLEVLPLHKQSAIGKKDRREKKLVKTDCKI